MPLMSLEFLHERDISIGRTQAPTTVTIAAQNGSAKAPPTNGHGSPGGAVEMGAAAGRGQPVAEGVEAQQPLPGMVADTQQTQQQPKQRQQAHPATPQPLTLPQGSPVPHSASSSPGAVLESLDTTSSGGPQRASAHAPLPAGATTNVAHGMVLPFQPLPMTFAKVCYDVDMPKDFEA